MERDMNMAFNYHDISIELYNDTQKARQLAAQQTAGSWPTRAIPDANAQPMRSGGSR